MTTLTHSDAKYRDLHALWELAFRLVRALAPDFAPAPAPFQWQQRSGHQYGASSKATLVEGGRGWSLEEERFPEGPAEVIDVEALTLEALGLPPGLSLKLRQEHRVPGDNALRLQVEAPPAALATLQTLWDAAR